MPLESISEANRDPLQGKNVPCTRLEENNANAIVLHKRTESGDLVRQVICNEKTSTGKCRRASYSDCSKLKE